jgi:protein-S-isoprenylcysteine O-methyltransferase Ste14
MGPASARGAIMSAIYLMLAALNLTLIGLLPRIFFDSRGRKNAMWWATAAPFFAAGAVLVLCFAGVWQPWYLPAFGGAAVHEIVAVPFAGASIALIAYTIGTHRVPLALWHQDDDAPRSIVTYGAYKYVRHPFYSAFLLALVGTLIACPHPGTLACLIYTVLMLHYTADKEEQKLSNSEFGGEYRDYLARTGRFLPRLGNSSSA